MIELRPMQAADKELVRSWRNRPEVSQYMYTDQQIGPEEHEKWFRKTLVDPTKCYWIITHEGESLGVACLYDIDRTHRRCYWAFYLADSQMRGKGLGGFVERAVLRHVFDSLQLNKLCCEVLADNRAVVALHEKFGFRQEGYFREHIFKGGQMMDIVCLAMARPEWEAKRPEIERKLKRIEERHRRN